MNSLSRKRSPIVIGRITSSNPPIEKQREIADKVARLLLYGELSVDYGLGRKKQEVA